MLIYRNPNKCAFMSCNRRCKKLLCKNHINKKLDFVPYFIQINPFYLELIIINLQTFWKNKWLLMGGPATNSGEASKWAF